MKNSSKPKGDVLVQEMIRIAMQRISKAQDHPYVSKKKILKVLYRAKECMSDDNPVKNHLVYYWYKDGPYSEMIYANIDQLVSGGRITAHRRDASETYKLVPEYELQPLMTHDSDIDEAGREISQVADKFVNIHDMVRDIYARAPYKWYSAYNLEFKPKFESHCNAILDGHQSAHTNDDILNWLDDAVLDYPPLPKFMEHRRIFMDFAKMLNSFLRSDSSRTRKDLLETLQILSDRVWEVFAYGVRVDCHNDYYDDRVDDWKAAYAKKIDDLDGEVREHIKKFDVAVVDDRRLAPEVEDMILHPEKHDFKPWILDSVESRSDS